MASASFIVQGSSFSLSWESTWSFFLHRKGAVGLDSQMLAELCVLTWKLLLRVSHPLKSLLPPEFLWDILEEQKDRLMGRQ